jgi:hypothetical protein
MAMTGMELVKAAKTASSLNNFVAGAGLRDAV